MWGSTVAAGALDLPWPDRLIARHRAVRSAVLNSGYQRAGVTNEKCSDVKVFKLPGFGVAATYLGIA